MRAGNQAGRGRRLALYIVAALAAVVVLGTSLGLMGYIDQKLKQGAEQQVVTFTQQAASNVTDRIFIVQNAIGAFEVQSADPAAVVPALQGNGFTVALNRDLPPSDGCISYGQAVVAWAARRTDETAGK